ncbi:MAG: alkaline phosphatase D family protein [Myxococcales bacterium]|nr:alkaline phosphatase D family protein [Myxococcales bacterium]
MSDNRDKDQAKLSRRDLLIGGGAALTTLALGAGASGCSEPPDDLSLPPPDDSAAYVDFDAAAIADDEKRFPLAAQVGALAGSSGLLVGYCADDSKLRLRVWREAEEPGKQFLVDERSLSPVDGYVRETLRGLSPGHAYRAALFAEEGGKLVARSPINHFRAPYPPGYRPTLTIGATACTSMKRAPFPALSQLAVQDIDIFCHTGDMSYNDGAKDREGYREKWRRTLSQKGYRELLPVAPLYHTLDDHEVSDNSVLYKLPAEQRAIAREALFEHVATPDLGDGRIWNSYRWGDTVEIFVLDCRSERDVASRESDDPIYISKAQLEWFRAAITASKCHFKLVLNSVPIIGFPDFWIFQDDRWQGYERQRQTVLDIVDSIDNVWFVSGDFHIGMVARVEREGPRRDLWEILAGPGGNDNQLWTSLEANPVLFKRGVPPEQFDFFSSKTAATTLTLDPRRNTVRVRFVGDDGEVRYDKALSQGRDPEDRAGDVLTSS